MSDQMLIILTIAAGMLGIGSVAAAVAMMLENLIEMSEPSTGPSSVRAEGTES